MSDGAVRLNLTAPERAALDALTAGLGALADRDLGREAAVVAAVELGLVRLRDDFDVPDPARRARVVEALDDLRSAWSRGNACL